MVNFSDLKKNRKQAFQKLQKDVEQRQSPSNKYQDQRFWKLGADAAGNGSATIRFLPAAPEEDFPFVQIFKHSFRTERGLYIENCLTTVNKPSPVVEYNKSVFERDGDESKQGRDQARQTKYIANILVIDDSNNPENNGKVFLYEYGKQIYKILNDTMFPEDDDEEGIPVFDLYDGANFKLKMTTKVVGKNKFPNYETSKFSKPSDMEEALGAETLEKIWRSQHKLTPFIDPENAERFKPYETLKNRLIDVVGADAAAFFGVQQKSAGKTAEATSPGKTTEAKTPRSVVEDEDEDDTSSLKLTDLDDEDDTPPFDIDDDNDDGLESFQDLMNR